MITKKDLDSSINTLRDEMKKGFRNVNNEFKNVYSEFKNVNNEFKNVYSEFRDVNNEFKNVRKEFKNDIETAVAQIIEAVMKHTASKEDLKDAKHELQNEIKSVRNEVSEIKRTINDLKADSPTPQEFAGHEIRINKLEEAVFTS